MCDFPHDFLDFSVEKLGIVGIVGKLGKGASKGARFYTLKNDYNDLIL